MMTMDPYILLSQKEEAERRIVNLELQVALARQHAMRWEHEAKDLRRQVVALRMECDTDRITRDLHPTDSLPEPQG